MGLLNEFDFRARNGVMSGNGGNGLTTDRNYIPMEVIGCDLNEVYELYIWRWFVSDFGFRSNEVVTWKKVESGYYKAYLKNGNVVFYDIDDRFYRELTEEQAKFNNEDEWRKEFSRRLIRIMNLRELNQYDLAKLTGCSQSTISHYISGKRTPSSFMVNTIAKVCECSVDYLTHF